MIIWVTVHQMICPYADQLQGPEILVSPWAVPHWGEGVVNLTGPAQTPICITTLNVVALGHRLTIHREFSKILGVLGLFP